MESFELIQEARLAQMLRERQELRLEISEAVVCFKKHIPQVSFAEPMEIPPSSAALTAEAVAQVIIHAGQDLNGKFIRLVIAVYSFGGKILYKSSGPTKYEAHVQWPAAQRGVQPDHA